MSEANKALIRKGFEVGMNERRFEVFDEVVAPAYVNHNLPAPGPGPEGLKQVVGMFIAAFPDFRVEIHDVLAEGNLVTTRGTFTGTHQGDFMGIPPTGKHVSVNYIDIWRLENGKAVENWVQMDQLGMLQQLGVVPSQS